MRAKSFKLTDCHFSNLLNTCLSYHYLNITIHGLFQSQILLWISLTIFYCYLCFFKFLPLCFTFYIFIVFLFHLLVLNAYFIVTLILIKYFKIRALFQLQNSIFLNIIVNIFKPNIVQDSFVYFGVVLGYKQTLEIHIYLILQDFRFPSILILFLRNL